ncbi:MAG: hypothetical protein QOH12_587 [Solirubrobacteraceae bacterium]|nr:hypothetical protein [Solirubrobacteraceae bacterium]
MIGGMVRGSLSLVRRLRRRSVLLVVLAAGCILAGCGGSGATGGGAAPGVTAGGAGGATAGGGHDSRGKRSAQQTATGSAARLRAARAAAKRRSRARHPKVKAIAPGRASRAVVARVDATSDATLVAAQHQARVSAGAPSDAEIRQQIAAALRAGVALPTGNTSDAFVRSVTEANISDEQALAVGASIPVASWNPDGSPIANWIVPVLQWAFQNGWTGGVTSGFRTYRQQAALNAAGDFSAPAGSSNHESTQYPGGAVDVSAPAQLISVLAGYPGRFKLHGGVLGPIDPEHFSATGE